MSGELSKSTMAAAAVAALLVGCIADGTSSSGGGGYVSPPTSSSSSGGGSQPLFVDVDTNGTLVTTPGQGIGVYVEYEAGGHWRVSLTCDTLVTNLACNFVVDAYVAVGAGTIQNAAGIVASSTNSLGVDGTQTQVRAVTTTSSGTDAMTFDTTPGATLTVSVQLDAPVSFFFVQDNRVNGGYTGPLTNPLMFQPSAP